MVQAHLEKKETDYPANDIPESVRRVFNAAQTAGIFEQTRIFKVESDYYEWELEQRRDRLEAPTTNHLCKSLLFQNTKWQPLEEQPQEDFLNPMHPKYALIVVQYTDKLSTKKLNAHMKGRCNNRQGLKKFNMRMAPEEDAIRLTGFGNNGVSPLGMLEKIPVILTQNVSNLDTLYLGSGHPDWKIALAVQDLLKCKSAEIVDLSE